MDKLEIYMEARKLNYIFPARKWYESKKKGRMKDMMLILQDKEYTLPIHLHIIESGTTKISARLYPEDEAALFLQMLRYYDVGLNYQYMIIYDGEDRESIQLITPTVAENVNDLQIVTKNAQEYSEILEELYYDTGLIGCCVENAAESHGNGVILYHDFERRIPIHSFPKGITFYDLSYNGKYEREIQKKRPDIRYFGLSKYLDTVVKLMYNTLVIDGNVNPKTKMGNNKKLQK